MSATDYAHTLILMASKDLKALRNMTDPVLFDDEIFGFHAQQTVEKLLKAWISSLGETFPLTHDIRYLLLTLSKLGCEIDALKNLITLNVYAVQFRYEPTLEISEVIDRTNLLIEIEKAFKLGSDEINNQR
jgi:HEPN domain-containing protein